MNREIFKYLPQEIIINIVSRIPVRTIARCKCVCKSWLNLLESPVFVKSHLPKSKPGLVFNLQEDSRFLFQIIEFEDSLDHETQALHYNPIIKFDIGPFADLPCASITIQGSADGLLLFTDTNTDPNPNYICNPITREYIELPFPEESVYEYPAVATYGFGVSKISGQHKVVRIFHDWNIPKFVCQVYTLGTGSWRSIAPGASLKYKNGSGKFVNGNIYWSVSDFEGDCWISSFDLQTETFSKFLPPPDIPRSARYLGFLVPSGDSLCLFDNTSDDEIDDEIVIWLMKGNGLEKSWSKAFVISRYDPDYELEVVYPVKVYEHDGIVMGSASGDLLYYSNKTKTTSEILKIGLRNLAILHTPSFLSLKSFETEIVKSF